MHEAWVAAAIAVAVAVMFAAGRLRRRTGADRFYTEYAVEEPTRAYTPHTGTVPVGPWGASSWSELTPGTDCSWPPM